MEKLRKDFFISERKKEKIQIINLFNQFHDNLEHFFKMNKEIKDLKKDPKISEDEDYKKNLDEKLNEQIIITKDKFWKLEILLDRSWFEKKTIKLWIKKWMSKYKDDPNYTKNMIIFIKNECRDFIDYFPEKFFI